MVTAQIYTRIIYKSTYNVPVEYLVDELISWSDKADIYLKTLFLNK
jgi:hypothetical protein